MSKWWIRSLVVIALALALWWLRTSLLTKEPLLVTVHTVDVGRVESIATNSRAGTVRARRRARLSPETGGQVVEIPFREGETVRRGDVILRLAPASQDARMNLAERDLEAARAEQQRACLAAQRSQREFDNAQRLSDEKILPTDQLDQADSTRQVAQATCQASKAQVARAQAGLVLAGSERSKTEIRAPFDGLVADVATEVGEWATPSPPALPVPPVIDIFDPASIYVSAPMDEVDSAKIKVGQTARILIDSHRELSLTGTVTRVASFVVDVESQNRTVEVDLEIADAELARTLLPGTSADVEIVVHASESTLRLPTRALIEGSRVLVVQGGEIASQQVVTGLRNWEFSEVREGIEKGDLVITSLDQDGLIPGTPVEILEESGSP